MIVPEVNYNELGASATENRDQLGKEAFLKLLIAQLSHQDPLAPMDSMEFTSQLSQFSQLEQMVGLNEKLESMLLYQASLNNWQGMAIIDKEVDALGDWIELSGGVATTIGYRLEGISSGVTAQIFDQSGKVVRALDEGAQEPGNHLIQWDGKDESGNTLPNGRYTFSVTAGNEVGNDPISTFVRGRVTGLSFEGGMPFLLMGNEKISFANIMEIRGISES